MVASFQNPEQKLTKFLNFKNSRKFPPRIHQFPGIPAGIFGMAHSREFPGIRSPWCVMANFVLKFPNFRYHSNRGNPSLLDLENPLLGATSVVLRVVTFPEK